MTEKWAVVPSFPLYEASDQGEIRSRRGVLRQAHRNGGYHEVVLSLGTRGTRKAKKVHHLVLEAFVGPRPEGTIGRHLDDNQSNNMLANLAWGTQKENADDRRRNGGYARKTACPKGHAYEMDRKFLSCPECLRLLCAERARRIRALTGEWDTTRRFREDPEFREARLAGQRARRAAMTQDQRDALNSYKRARYAANKST